MRNCCLCDKALDGSVCADVTPTLEPVFMQLVLPHSHCRPKTPTWRPPLQPRPLLCASREISQSLPAHAVGSGTKTELQLSDEAQGCMLMLLLQGDPGYQVLSTSITIGPFFVPPQTHKQEHLWQKEFRCWEDSRKDRISFDPHNSSRHGHYCPKIRIEEIPYPR